MLQYKVDLKPARAGGTAGSVEDILEEYSRAFEASVLEKKWMHERLSWLFTPQSFLFTALGISYSDKAGSYSDLLKVIHWVIPAVGMIISILVLLAVWAACVRHEEWTGRMARLAKAYESLTQTQLTFGTGPNWPASLARWVSPGFPLVFLIAWTVLLAYVLRAE